MEIKKVSQPTTQQTIRQGVEKVSLPPSNYPFEATLFPGQDAILHGNVRFINSTNQKLKLTIQYDLQKGYHVYIESDTTTLHQYVSMHSAQKVKIEDGQLYLEKIVKQPSMRILKAHKQRV